MGGRGSGRRPGAGLWRDKCHEFHAIDLTWLKNKDCLRTGYRGGLSWYRRWRKTGNIDYVVEANGLRLLYRTRAVGGEAWTDVEELIPFAHTTTNFSGRRTWFQCPGCRRRCRILYGGSRFRCRRCLNLVYETQYEPAFARSASKALKIREKLGDGRGVADPFPDKPKGMHWRTYRRLELTYYHLCDAWSVGIMRKWKIGER